MPTGVKTNTNFKEVKDMKRASFVTLEEAIGFARAQGCPAKAERGSRCA